MSVAYRVQDYIAEHDVPWDPVSHDASQSSIETARLAHVPPDRMAKAVVLEDDEGYVLAVIAAHRRLNLSEFAESLQRDLRLASERELPSLFSDCLPGAVPPLGEAYGMPTVWDEDLGDMRGIDFGELMRSARPLQPP